MALYKFRIIIIIIIIIIIDKTIELFFVTGNFVNEKLFKIALQFCTCCFVFCDIQ